MMPKPCYLCGHSEHDHLVTFPNDPYLKRLSSRTDHSVAYLPDSARA